MKITYDRQADALYIRLRERAEQVRVSRWSEDVACDVDADDRIVGIEILNASAFFDRPDVPSVRLEHVRPEPTRS